eukprot:12338179-Karenia_brevis.AAC.1
MLTHRSHYQLGTVLSKIVLRAVIGGKKEIITSKVYGNMCGVRMWQNCGKSLLNFGYKMIS